MAAAQRKRWAAVQKVAATPGPPPVEAAKKKPRLSPEGLARIIAATKRRWAALRKAKAKTPVDVATPKAAAKKTKAAVSASTAAAKPAKRSGPKHATRKAVVVAKAARKRPAAGRATGKKGAAPSMPEAAAVNAVAPATE